MSTSSKTFFPDLRPPKSPKRFFSPFTTSSKDSPPPLPSAPSSPPSMYNGKGHTPTSSFGSTQSFGLGYGAQVVRTPSDALKGVRQMSKGNLEIEALSPGQESERDFGPYPVTAPLRKASMDTFPGVSQITDESRDCGHNHHHPFRMKSARQSLSGRKDSTKSMKDTRQLVSSPISPPLPFQPNLGSMSFDPFTVSPPFFPDKESRKSVHTVNTTNTTRPRDPKRATIKPPPKMSLPPTPFSATLLSKSIKPSPTQASGVLITLEFAYALDDEPINNSHVSLPWSVLRHAGGHLCRFVLEQLEEGMGVGIGMGPGFEDDESGPEMTDGSSAEESDLDSEYGLGALLRDEYLMSLLVASPSQSKFPTSQHRPPLPRLGQPAETVKKRAVTRNQYTQKEPYPSPLSPLTSKTAPLNIRRHAPPLTVKAPEEVITDGGGFITELKILLLRDATPYHLIAARLIGGTFPRLVDGKRKKVEEECIWLGMAELARETEEQKVGGRSMVRSGGAGYI